MENWTSMDPDFEQNYFSLTAKGIYRLGHDSIRLLIWIAYYDEYFEIIDYFDLMGSILKHLNERSEW